MYILFTVTTTTARWSAYFKTISKHFFFFFFFENIKESNENDVKIFELFLITEHFKSM